MVILPSSTLFFWTKIGLHLLSSCLIPVECRPCSPFRVSLVAVHLGVGNCFFLPWVCWFHVVNSQAWFSGGSSPFHFLGVMPPPARPPPHQAGARCPPLLCHRAGSHLVKPIILISLYFPLYSVLWCFPPSGSSYGTQTKLSLSLEVLSTSMRHPLPTAPLAHPLIYPLSLSPFSFVVPPQPDFYILYPHQPTALQNVPSSCILFLPFRP